MTIPPQCLARHMPVSTTAMGTRMNGQIVQICVFDPTTNVRASQLRDAAAFADLRRDVTQYV
jgi:hypothetical protein